MTGKDDAHGDRHREPNGDRHGYEPSVSGTTGVRGDRGSASIWVLACAVLLLLVAGVATIRGVAVLARHRAESAADLSALAAAGRIGVGIDECPRARGIARLNGARLSRCQVHLAADGRSGTVLVQVVFRATLPIVGVQAVAASARAGR